MRTVCFLSCMFLGCNLFAQPRVDLKRIEAASAQGQFIIANSGLDGAWTSNIQFAGDTVLIVQGGLAMDNAYLLNGGDSLLVWRGGKVYRRDASTLMSSIDIGGELSSRNVVYGSGIADYVARWVTDSTLGTGILRDDGVGVGVGMAPNSTYIMRLNGSMYFNTDGQAIYSNSGNYFCPECSTNRMDFFNGIGSIRFIKPAGNSIQFYKTSVLSNNLLYEFTDNDIEVNIGVGLSDRTLPNNYNFTPRTNSGSWPATGNTQIWSTVIDNVLNSRGTKSNATWSVYDGADSSLVMAYELVEGLTVYEGNIAVGSNGGIYPLEVNKTSGVLLPDGTTPQRPTGAQGVIRFNTDSLWWEGYTGMEWRKFGFGNSEFQFYGDDFDLGAGNVDAALDTLAKKISTNCLVNNVMQSDGITAREAYKQIYNNEFCPTVIFNNPSGDTGFVYTFNRTALIRGVPGKNILIEPGVVVQLDTFPAGAGDADTAYVDENAAGIQANGVFSFYRVDNLVFENYGKINASNKIGNTPLGEGTSEVRRSTHAIRINECENAEIHGGIVQDVWFGVFVADSDNANVHDVVAIRGDTASSGPRRFETGNDDQCCGDFNNAAVAVGQGSENAFLVNIRATGFSEVVDLNPICYNPVLLNLFGEDVFESVFETSGAIGFKAYNVTGRNCYRLLDLSPYLNQSSVGAVFGAKIEYDTNAQYWLKNPADYGLDEVYGILSGFESSIYDAAVVLSPGVDFVDKAAVFRKRTESSGVYDPIRGSNFISVFSDSAYFQESPIEQYGGDLKVFFNGYLSDNQTLVDVRKGPAKIDIQQAVNNDTASVNTTLLTVATKNTEIVRYDYASDISGFDDTLKVTTASVLERLHPIRTTCTLPTERDDISFAFFPEGNYRWAQGDTASWESAKGETGLVAQSGEIQPIWLSETEGFKFSANAVLVNTGTIPDNMDWNNHRVTARFRIDTIGTGDKTIFRWGGNNPYRVLISSTAIKFEVSSTGWSNQSYSVAISEDTWYTISVIISGSDLTVRFGTDGSMADVITYTASQALATGTGTFSINARTDGTAGNAKTYSHIIISNGADSETTYLADEEYIQGLTNCSVDYADGQGVNAAGWGLSLVSAAPDTSLAVDTSLVDSKAARRYKDFNTYTANPDTLSPYNGAVYGFDNVGFGWTQQIGLSNLDAGDSFTVFLVNSDTNAQTFDVSGTGTGGFIRPSANGDLNADDTEAFTGASHYLEFIWDGSNFWIKE